MHTWKYTYIHTYIHTYIYTYMHTYMHTCIRVYMYVCMYVCMYVSTYVCLYAYMHTCISYILLIPRWRKSINLLLGRESSSSSSSSSSYCFYMCEILVPRLPSWNCYRLGHCTTHTHRKIRGDPTQPSICVHLSLPLPSVWMS